MPDARDQQLLDRLNALRPTPVTLNPNVSSFASSAAPLHVSDTSDLTSRFARLQTTSPPQSQSQPASALYNSDGDAKDTEANEEDELSLDDLLADLHDEHQNTDLKIVRSDVDKARDLMRQARAALGMAQHQQESEGGSEKLAMVEGAAGIGTETQEEEGAETQQMEDDEADEYIQQALAAAELGGSGDEMARDGAEGEGTKNAHRASDDNDDDDANNPHPTFSLPSAPTSLPSTPSAPAPAPPGTLHLPSTPTSIPRTTRPPPSSSSLTPTKSSPSTFTDAEIATWCVICNEDATVKCLGCEGDLYCAECWAEGHTGRDAGYEERRHRAVRYVRDGKLGKGKEKRRLVGAS